MPQIRAGQIRGLVQPTMESDIKTLQAKTQSTQAPVATKADLSLVGNNDGDTRLVLNEDNFYIWDEPTNQWKPKNDKSTETRYMPLLITADGQDTFQTDIAVGIENGLASLQTVQLEVNGITQTLNVDYTLETSSDDIPKLIILWKSTDFQLETTDQTTVIYDVLLLR